MDNLAALSLNLAWHIIFAVISFFMAKKYSRNIVLWSILGFLFLFIAPLVLLFIGNGYRSWPTVNQYLEENPELGNGQGIACIKCGSKSIRNWGISNGDDKHRLHSCNSCGTELYRSGP
jgi:hypothetical protein